MPQKHELPFCSAAVYSKAPLPVRNGEMFATYGRPFKNATMPTCSKNQATVWWHVPIQVVLFNGLLKALVLCWLNLFWKYINPPRALHAVKIEARQPKITGEQKLQSWVSLGLRWIWGLSHWFILMQTTSKCHGGHEHVQIPCKWFSVSWVPALTITTSSTFSLHGT